MYWTGNAALLKEAHGNYWERNNSIQISENAKFGQLFMTTNSTKTESPVYSWTSAKASKELFNLKTNLIFIVFFPLPFTSLIPPTPQQSPHCCPCPWVLFPFCSVPPPLNSPLPPPTSCQLLSIYESVSVLLVLVFKVIIYKKRILKTPSSI